jgi:hypothetical protein
LRQAAQRFRELSALVNDGNDDLIGPYLQVSGEEPLWRSVLVWVRAELYQRGDPGAGAVLARLQAEYRVCFGHDADLGAMVPATPLSEPGSSPP